MICRIIVSPTALKMLRKIKDRRVRRLIQDRISQLAEDPEKQGKPLVGELSEYRSIRAAGQRYRVIYRVEEKVVQVFVVAAGIRREGDKQDIYALARRLLRLGLLDPEQ